MEPFVVAPVVSQGGLAPTIDLAPVVSYFETVSAGRCRLLPVVLAPIEVQSSFSHWSERGGLGRYPRNSQALLQAAMPGILRSPSVMAAGERILLVVCGGTFRPHTWTPRGKALPMGPDRFCRRYAVVPAGVSRTVLCHELGHLLFDWPDLLRVRGLGDTCLMATPDRSSDDPPWPCAPLRLRMGWIAAAEAGRATKLEDLRVGDVWRVARAGGTVLVERARSGGLHVYEADGTARQPIRWFANIVDHANDQTRPLLAVLRERMGVVSGISKPLVPA